MVKYFRLLFISVIFIFAGCAQIQDKVNPAPSKFVPKTEKYGNYTFVVPANFKLKDEATLMYKSGNKVRAYLVYAGTGSIGKIVKFLDNNLMKLGWKKSSEVIGSSAVLVYKRNNQLLMVKIERIISGTYIKFMLTCP